MRPHIVLNPAASAGRTGRRQGELLRLFEAVFPGGLTLEVTTKPFEAMTMTRKALRDGCELVVAVGGDGTVSEVVNGFFEAGSPINPRAELGLVCSGTAQDIARNLRLPSDIKDQIDLLSRSGRMCIDMGSVTFHDEDGNSTVRYFINDCQAGIAAKVAERVTPSLKRLGGFLAFGLVSTIIAATYRAQAMEITVDSGPALNVRCIGVVVMNGRFAGGGMDFAPRSMPNDDILDVLVIHDRPVLSRLINFPKIYSGKHINLDWITYQQGKRIEIRSNEQVRVEADGEVLGYLPCVIEVVPRAINVKTSDRTEEVPRSSGMISSRTNTFL